MSLCTCGAPLSYCRSPKVTVTPDGSETLMQRVKREARNEALEEAALDVENDGMLGKDDMSFREWCEWTAARFRALRKVTK